MGPSSTSTAAKKPAQATIGAMVRSWRTRRHLSQLALATNADVSARHLSFIETGRAKPSSDMVLHLAEHLDVPLRDRNDLLVAAGFAPRFSDTDLDGADMAPVRAVLDTILASHQPAPAVVIDRHWNVEAMNDAAGLFAMLVDPALLEPRINIMRLTMHPGGLAQYVVNADAVAHHLCSRLRSQVERTGDMTLAALLEEIEQYPSAATADSADETVPHPADGLVLPVHLRIDGVDLRFISTVTSFGAPLDVATSELAIESFHPADAETSDHLAAFAAR